MTRRVFAGLAAGALCVGLAGCATSPSSATGAQHVLRAPAPMSTALPTPPAADVVPDEVDIAEWDGIAQFQPFGMCGTVGQPLLIDEQVAYADAIIVGRAIAQHPVADDILPSTESTIEVTEVIKGEVTTSTITLIDEGVPTYAPLWVEVDGVPDPPLFDRTYLYFLSSSGTYDAAGNWIPLGGWGTGETSRWVQQTDRSFTWDTDAFDALPTIGEYVHTIEEVRDAVN